MPHPVNIRYLTAASTASQDIKMRRYFGIAYALFLAVFVVLPLLIIMGYAFTDEQGHLTASNLVEFVTNTRTLGTVLYSVIIAFVKNDDSISSDS